MSDNIISLVPKKETQPDVNQDCVKLLEGLLQLAKEGKIIAGACVFETSDDSTYTVWSEDVKYHLTIAGLRIIEHKIIQDALSHRPSFEPRTS